MGVLTIILLVFFVIIAILLILLVLVQNEEGEGLGGIFAGGSGSAFGSRSGNVLTRATSILGALFFVVCLSLALLSRTPSGAGVEEEGRRLSTIESGSSWLEEEINPGTSYNDFILDDFSPSGFGTSNDNFSLDGFSSNDWSLSLDGLPAPDPDSTNN